MKKVVISILSILCLSTATPICADDAVQFTNDPEEDSSPAWSPDDSQIAYTRGNFQNYQIYKKSMEGGEPLRIIVDSGAREPAWSVDGQSLYWTRLEVLWGVFFGEGGGDHIQITSPADGGGKDESPEFSPLGDRIAFQTTFSGDSQSSIATIPVGSPAVVTRVTTQSGDRKWPTWSPSAEEIAFAASGEKGWDIRVIPSIGGEERELVSSAANDLHPSWSPNGRWIAFASDREGNFDIWIVPAEGGDVIQVTDDPGHDLWPTWAPDGGQIAFQSVREGQSDIWIIAPPPVPVTRTSWGELKQILGR